MTVSRSALCALLSGLALCGCGTDYAWRSKVPQGMRTVSVPTFRNESDLQEAGSIATRQVLREFQREGTFEIRQADEAALQVQGTVKFVSGGVKAYDRRRAMRLMSYDMTAQALVSVVDKRGGKVIVDNKPYTAQASFAAGQDITNAERDACGRLMEDLARQIVDDVLALDL